jgi:hypothetical protein
LKKVLEILRIPKGRVLVCLNGVEVLQTMVEWHVQPLKLRARLLCDFTGVEDSSQESMETLEASEVTKWVARLVLTVINDEIYMYLEYITLQVTKHKYME